MEPSERNAMQAPQPGVRPPDAGPRRRKAPAGMTLVELLVVLAILMLLMGVMASALGAFTHTSRVEAAAETLCEFYRSARYQAMKQSGEVLPMLLRDKRGRITGVHAEKALRFNGALTESEAAPVVYPPAVKGSLSSPWSFTRRAAAAPLAEGGFAFVIGAATLDLNDLGQPQAYPELVYLKATPPASKSFANDAAQYRFEILARGVHNTRVGTFDATTMGFGGADLYVVASAANANANVTPANAADYALSGVNLPDHIAVDMAPAHDAGPSQPLCATVTAQAAIFRDRSALAIGGGLYEPARYMPLWLPVFTPDGHVTNGPRGPGLGGLEAQPSAYRDQTLRVQDTITREVRYITIRCSDGQVFVGTKLPPAYGLSGDGIPTLDAIPEYDPTSSTTTTTSTSASSSNSTTTSTSSSQTTASTTSASTSSASSTSSTTASSTSSSTTSTSASSTTSTSASSTTSTATSGATTSATSSTTTTSNSTSSTTASSTSNSTTSTSASSTSTTTSTTSGAAQGGGSGPGTGGGSSGNGKDWEHNW